MPTFVMQAGVPYVEVNSKCEGGNTTLNMSQKRYLDTPTLFNQPNDQIWQIPVCAKGINGTQAGTPQCFLLTKREQDFKLKGCYKFVFPNSNALGYYRYGYDNAALHAMGNEVEKSLTPDERISLMGNEWALMRIGKHSVGDYLALGAQLKNTPGAACLPTLASTSASFTTTCSARATVPPSRPGCGRSSLPCCSGSDTTDGRATRRKTSRSVPSSSRDSATWPRIRKLSSRQTPWSSS